MLDTLLEPQTLIAIFAAVAAFASVIAVALPMLQKNELNSRMQSAALERADIRARERARLMKEAKQGSLRTEGSGFMRRFVERFDLKKKLADENTFMNLVMAGYRRQSHIYVFLFFRVVLPIIMFVVALFFVFVVMKLQQPFMVRMGICLVVAYIGFYLPNLYVKNVVSKRQLQIRRAWPDALDLMLICVESGISIEQAFQRVAKEIGIQSTALAEELILTNAELSYLQERRQAYENLAKRTGLDTVKGVATALIQAERYGTPLAVALRVLAQESRDMRMAEAEKKAAALPPKLTVPMIVFFLPVLFLVVMGPAMIQVFRNFG